MAQDLLSEGLDPQKILEDVRDLLMEVDRMISEGTLNDPDWEHLRVEWCLTSPFLLQHLENAERKLSLVFPCMKVPAVVSLCNMLMFLQSRISTLELSGVVVPEKIS
jgi:hypothetical protein